MINIILTTSQSARPYGIADALQPDVPADVNFRWMRKSNVDEINLPSRRLITGHELLSDQIETAWQRVTLCSKGYSPETLANISLGLISRKTSYPSPIFSIVPRRRFSILCEETFSFTGPPVQ